MNCPNRQTAAVGAGGRGCNPWGQGPAFERPVQFQGLGVALGSQRDPVGSGSSSGLRFRGGEVRQSRAPGTRHSPLPPCSRAWWGGTRAPAGAGCSVSSAARPGKAAARRERCPLAPASPPPRSGDAQAPAHLRGSAPPPARFPRGPWRFRTCESGRSAAQKMDAGGWARTLRSAPGAVQARRPLDLGRRRAGLRGAAGREASAQLAPPLQSQARIGLRGHRAGPAPSAGLVHPSPMQF